MPSSKKKNNNKKKNKLLKGGKSCPTGSQKVCIKKGDLIKLLKKAAIKNKTKKAKLNKRKKQGTAKAVPEKKESFLGSMFGSDEEALPKVEEEKSIKDTAKLVEETPNSVEDTSIEETSKPVEDTSIEEVETESKEETDTEPPKKAEPKSFLGSIFGTEEKKPAAPAQ
jgi:hypothetical protein